MLLKNLYNIDVTQRKELDKMVKEHTRDSIPMLQPQQPSNDIISVLETRNINFNKSFTQEFCDEVIELLDKVQVYDELTNREKYMKSAAMRNSDTHSMAGVQRNGVVFLRVGYHKNIKTIAIRAIW